MNKLLSFQLRPHIAEMLADYCTQVQSRLPENLRAKVTQSLIIRKLIMRQSVTRDALNYVSVGRKRDGAQVNVRVRVNSAEYDQCHQTAKMLDVPYAQLIAALIVDALHPNGNYPANPDTKPTQPTK